MIEVQDLSVARGGVPVATGLSFSVRAGEAVVLRGPNGVGKTTLLRTLAGLQPPFAGSVSVGSETLAYSGHADGVKATLSVAENLRFWASVFGEARIDHALAAYDLSPLAERAAMHLSAGQRRRLGLARMLVTGRKLWLMDEPTVSLDAASVAQFAKAVEAHCADGGAAVLATHIDLGLAQAREIDLGAYRATAGSGEPDLDEAFL